MSINNTCSAPGTWSPSGAKAAFFWPCLSGHRWLTPPPHSEWSTISEGQEEAKTWSCKSIKQAMGGSGGGRGHEKQTINPKSISTAAEASSPGVHSAVMSSRGGLRVTLEPVPGTVLHQHSTESFLPFIHFLSPILSAILSTLILWVACQPTGT